MILALDTSGPRCGVALWNETTAGELTAFLESDADLRHNEMLLDQIRTLQSWNREAFASLTAVAVSSGPGSFTGLRVGMSVAKGLCWVWKLPLVTVPTLAGLAESAPPRVQRALPLMPARAREVYWRLFEYGLEGWTASADHTVSEVDRIPEAVQGPVFLCGEGYARHRAELDRRFSGRRIELEPGETQEPLVVATARLAAQRLLGGRIADLKNAEPEYYYPFPRGG
ncbi:MAG: tRNA (adenosine(37)-N6)-threonylcarbamoyltransferase complex dimerization subunit type 1 TsaB [Candidatus Zixiibacteriota bacterium]|nr:MAG: tRNA (adenosine(37)-N6)-threonylcarbamoyltransferase complex dimerization subunit type 1 TsaB [candidate division Zixibacteria bacterium]